LFVYSRPFETSMHGPLRHLWVADGPQRQLLETIDMAATGFVLAIRSGTHDAINSVFGNAKLLCDSLLRMLCPKGSLTTRACCGDSFLLRPPSRPLALAGASRHCAFAEKNGVERLGRLVRRRTGRQADRHRALLPRDTQIPEYVLKGCLAGFECSVTSTIDPRMMVTLTPCCGSSQVKVYARPVRPSVLPHELFQNYLS
jgi:hypothetical protein